MRRGSLRGLYPIAHREAADAGLKKKCRFVFFDLSVKRTIAPGPIKQLGKLDLNKILSKIIFDKVWSFTKFPKARSDGRCPWTGPVG